MKTLSRKSPQVEAEQEVVRDSDKQKKKPLKTDLEGDVNLKQQVVIRHLNYPGKED